MACVAAFKTEDTREAAAVTFLFSAAGVTLLGVSGAFWGLLAGGVVLAIKRSLTRQRQE
ncbi:MAG: benzoate/H(+) symporter BenE family transporter [Burkholderiaceae bacterium]